MDVHVERLPIVYLPLALHAVTFFPRPFDSASLDLSVLVVLREKRPQVVDFFLVLSVVRSNAVLHALSQYSNAVLDRGEINEGGLHEEARIGSSG